MLLYGVTMWAKCYSMDWQCGECYGMKGEFKEDIQDRTNSVKRLLLG